jgi:O-antigen/teichoic acid export membrane protein
LANWTGIGVRLLIGLWLTPFIVGHLGQESFGLWLLVGSLLGYFDLLDLGVRSALLRYAARERALGERGNLVEVVRRAMGAATAAAGLALVGFAALGAGLQEFLAAGSGVGPATVRTLVLLAGANLALGFVVAFFSGLLAGASRYDLTNAAGVTGAVVRAGLTVVVLRAGWGIAGLAAVVLASSALQCAAMAVLARRLYPGVRLAPLVPVGAVAKDLVRYGLSSVLLQLAVRIVYYTDSIVIAAYLTKSAVATFGIAATLIEFLRQFVSSMTNVLTPVASAMDAREDRAGLRSLLERGTSLSLVLAAPVLATFLLDRGRFIRLWVGPEFDGTPPVLRILAIGQAVALPTLTASVVLYAMNRHRWNAFLALGEAAANLALSIVLVRAMGLAGVAWGTTIPLLVTQVLVLPAYVCRLVGMRPLALLRRSYLPPLGAGLLYAAAFRGLFALADPQGFVAYFACVLASLVPYAAVAYAFVLDADVRRAITGRLLGARAS